MGIKLHYTLFIFYLLISNLAFAQQKNDTAAFDASNYLFPKFTDGIITMKDGSEAGGKLNYNTLLDEMQFIGDKNEILSFADPSKVVKVVIANRNFLYLKNYFVELIDQGNVSLFSRIHVKRWAEKIGAYGGTSSTSSIESVSSYSSGYGTTTKLSPNEKVSFQTELIFYVMFNNGKIKMVANKNDLLKCFASNKEIIKQEMERQNTKFNSIESVKKIIGWINANGIKD